jgi:hypothetical protein
MRCTGCVERNSQAGDSPADKHVRSNILINPISSSQAYAAYQAAQPAQPRLAQPVQLAQQPKQDTVHLHSAVTGDVDKDGDSH